MKVKIKSNLIILFMRENRLTKTQFAKQCDISIYTLRQILRGNTKMNMIYYFKVLNRMQIKMEDFWILPDENM